ncbi:MAG: carboxypeptidase-like regulatory domain-containing protein [Bacillota bacterium]|nr:carboxypeptidase-like regulatory domain-containing protein [Bacillota bacterium]
MKHGGTYRNLALLAALAVVVGSLTGCFGGSSTPTAPSANVSQVTGTILAPEGTAVAAATRRPMLLDWFDPVAYALGVGTPLAGAKVIALNFANGTQVGTEATTDSSGRYTISNIPAGIDVLIVATKDTAAGPVRLTRLVADLAEGTSPADVDAATSVVAEAYAVNMNKDFDLAADVVQAAVQAAAAELESVSTLDLTVGHGVIQSTLGSGLDPAARTEVQNIVKTAVAEPAKAMVRGLLTAGLTASGTFETEVEAEVNDFDANIIPYFQDVVNAFVEPYGYELTRVAAASYTKADLEAALSSSTAEWGAYHGTWTITDAGITQVVTITKSGDYETWTFSITGQNGFEETGSAPLQARLAPGQLNSNSFSFTARTSTDATPVSFSGSMNCSLDEQGRMTSGTLSGTFSSEKVNGQGTLTVQCFDSSPSVPQRITYNGTLRTVSRTYTGTFTTDLVLVPETPTVLPCVPSRMVFTGSYTSTTGVTAQGTLDAQFPNAATYDPSSGENSSNYLQGTFTFDGSFTKPGYQTINTDLTITRSSNTTYTADLAYSCGAATLAGKIAHQTDTGSTTVNLTNEAGLVVQMTVDGSGRATGTITGFGAQLATIAYNSALHMNQATYPDGEFNSLF